MKLTAWRRLFSATLDTSAPSMSTRPASGSCSLMRSLRMDDLPEPEGPTIAVRVPASTWWGQQRGSLQAGTLE
eukprot:scaffold241956_cov29-Tisochrysis_lutea.AAC.5